MLNLDDLSGVLSPMRPDLVLDDLTKIPDIMRKLKWDNAAVLLDKWFAGNANSNLDASPPDLSTIRMDGWALTFDRAKAAYDLIVRDKLWMCQESQDKITRILKRKGLLTLAATKFGNLNAPANIVHQDHAHFLRVCDTIAAHIHDPLDDLYGSLGTFEFAIAVEAKVIPMHQANKPRPPAHRVEIDRVGIYIKDKFDFKGEQPLGFWNFKTGDVSKSPGLNFVPISNGLFRLWRERSGKGCDYWLYSDVKILSNRKDYFIIE